MVVRVLESVGKTLRTLLGGGRKRSTRQKCGSSISRLRRREGQTGMQLLAAVEALWVPWRILRTLLGGERRRSMLRRCVSSTNRQRHREACRWTMPTMPEADSMQLK